MAIHHIDTVAVDLTLNASGQGDETRSTPLEDREATEARQDNGLGFRF